MPQHEIERVAVIGTGTIGISWAARFLTQGLVVGAGDPAPRAEAQLQLRRFINVPARF